jgi:hypothetical protein
MIVLFWFGLSVMTLLTAMLIAWPLFVVRHLTKDSDFTSRAAPSTKARQQRRGSRSSAASWRSMAHTDTRHAAQECRR